MQEQQHTPPVPRDMREIPTQTELRARIVAGLLPGPDDAHRAGEAARWIVEELPGGVVVDLVELLEAPLAHSHRLNAALLRERFPARRDHVATIDGETRG